MKLIYYNRITAPGGTDVNKSSESKEGGIYGVF